MVHDSLEQVGMWELRKRRIGELSGRQKQFMQRAFLAGALIGIIAPVIGVYLMLRRQVLMADTLSHVLLAGVAGGTLLGINGSIGGFIAAVVAALLVEWLRNAYLTYAEVSVSLS
ncbi:metal ABC transporter permease [Saccharibacillus kuerlensis]|uniref:Metal ABC transporter permease n=1 Tax=Saccharibacillus kuerlensis TaxID=459527 RepID=A0ABQ2L9V5_9BACL|nr:metal ABC transporter permease [Saccharibacillus kuerlensis]GGO07930.1 hypothetical protein GCM10010969_36870 [Saccharibacillus kuerlensis]